LYRFGERHRRLGVFLGTLAWVALVALVPAGPFQLAIPPLVIAGIAAAGAIAKAHGSRVQQGYQPSKKYIKNYENWQQSDLARLREKDPFRGEDLGFNRGQMAARMGESGTESEAEYRSDLGQIERATRGGGLATVSGAYHRGRQRATQAHLARIADIRRRNLIADAVQRREDLYNRIGAVRQAYEYGSGARQDRVRSRAMQTIGGGAMSFASTYGNIAGGGAAPTGGGGG
jgi:hypothetical protein